MSEQVRRGEGRYEIVVDGEVAGLTQFVDDDGRRVFFHTEVGEAYGGRGLASRLVREALDSTRAEGLRVVAVCPYVARLVQRHHDWDDVLDPVTPAAIEAIRAT